MFLLSSAWNDKCKEYITKIDALLKTYIILPRFILLENSFSKLYDQ